MSETTIKWYELEKKRRFEFSTDEDHVVKIEREAIPIIFVPGIMGSRLERGGTTIWDPSKSNKEAAATMAYFAGHRAQGRKELLIGPGTHDPGYLSVDLGRPDLLPGTPDEQQTRFERGWGGLGADSYMEFMEFLDNVLTTGQLFVDYGRYFEFPLYGAGYNWTADNEISGRIFAGQITDIMKTHKKDGTFCEKVILVTHSMGGLVSRSAMIGHGAAGDVLGVVHGVQPVTGGPAAYKRVRAGFGSLSEGGLNYVLGNYGHLVAPIFANSPGALELLPTKNYTHGNGDAQWLHIESHGTPIFKKPSGGDPYNEIYRQRTCFWRLIDENLVLPGSSGGSRGSPGWTTYTDNLKDAETFHRKLGHSKHGNTYEIYSTGLHTYETVVVDLEIDYTYPYDNAPLTAEMIEDIKKDPESFAQEAGEEMTTGVLGTFTLRDESINIEIKPATGMGDETVPLNSGKALKGTKGQAQVSKASHEGAFKNENVAVQQRTVNALRRMVKEHFNSRLGIK